ncbi:MAG: NUDIX domain-containing protein [Polyangiaceae bacterium]
MRRIPASDEENEFLARYDAKKFSRPSLAVDLVITSVDAESRLCLLLVRRDEHPFKGAWTLPGGFVREGESVPSCAARVLREKTSLEGVTLEEIRSFSEPQRDPRTWVVSIAQLALVPADLLSQTHASDTGRLAMFWEVLPKPDARGFSLRSRVDGSDGPSALGFDHDEIVAAGLSLLRQRVETSTLAFGLLPQKFTLPEAQRIVEAILGRKLDKAAFRTKVLSLGLVRPTTEERRGGAHRPARLYVASSGWDIHES